MSPNGVFTSTATDSLQMLAGLVLVLAFIAVFAWSLRRLHFMNARNGMAAKVVGTLALGSRERIAIVEIANQWLVIGITPGRMCMLAKLPRQELTPDPPAAVVAGDFSSWLSRYMDKPNAE
ncbi:flagellar biosynthetic protein FliO [Candidatus Methylospira mobilis]|uniref:Flagellar protein n=1 Tax=Candidatus Methylospira mobilis TaxID=1808979 RepID=A0A5Q0BEA9_9GAMM|nr:flagellar biosynthetic protein FliO [Candidatus Methylospira mobilis]QFY41859.1 flagellar biosynthetic protein FliO [Candidatus Methylospira mobilis]WNV06735.1 flagellar biosynthetic protein FliO [Candidatus Methylospira mobilis]